MAFTPIVWPLAVVLGIGVLALRRGDIAAYGLRFLAAIGTPCSSSRPGRSRSSPARPAS